MTKILTSLSGIIATCICIASYFTFAYINPEYKHLTKAFSELASVGQPNNLWAAFWAFLVPGLLITYFFLKLPGYINHNQIRHYPFVLIALSGLLMAIGASPMNYQDFSSISSLLHITGVMGGGLLFLAGAFTVTTQIKKDEYWKKLIKPLLLLTLLFIITGFFRESALPGLAQKMGILVYYLYISLFSWTAFKFNQSQRQLTSTNNP